MSSNTKVGYWDVVTDPKKMLGLGITVVLVIVVIVFFGSKIKSWYNQTKAEIKANNTISSGDQTKEWRTLANRIYNAMSGWGTDEDTVYAVLAECKSNADYSALKAAFATITQKHDLDWWINDELTSSELDKARAILNQSGVSNYAF